MPGPQEESLDDLFDRSAAAPPRAPRSEPAQEQSQARAPHVIEMEPIDIEGDPNAPEPTAEPQTQGRSMSRWERIGAMARGLGASVAPGLFDPGEADRARDEAGAAVEQEVSSWIGQPQTGTPEDREAPRTGTDLRGTMPARRLGAGLVPLGLADEFSAHISSGGGTSSGFRDALRSPAGVAARAVLPGPVSMYADRLAELPDEAVGAYERDVAARRGEASRDREDSPIASNVFEGAGALMGMGLTGGGSAASAAARGAPNALQGAARGLAGGALEGAVTGSAQGFGASSASTLGGLAEDTVMGGLAGSAMGGALGVVTGGLIGRGATRQARLAALQESAEEAAAAGGAATGMTASVSEADMLRAASPRVGRGGSLTTRDMRQLQRLPGGIPGHAQRIRDMGLTRFGDTAQDVNERANSVMTSAGNRIQRYMRQLDDSGSRIPRRELVGILRRLRSEYDSRMDVASAEGVRALDEQLARWTGATAEGTARMPDELTFTDARRLLTDIQEQAYTINGANSRSGTSALRDAAREIWGLLDEEATARLGAQDAGAYRTLRQQWQTANIAAEQSLESSMRQAQNMGVSLTDALAGQQGGATGFFMNQYRRSVELPGRAAAAELRDRIMPPERMRALSRALSGPNRPQWADTMLGAMQRGPQAAASAHFILSQTDTNYQRAMSEAERGEVEPLEELSRAFEGQQ